MDGFSENILCKRENMGEGKKDGDTVGSEAAQAVGVLHGVKKPPFLKGNVIGYQYKIRKALAMQFVRKGEKEGGIWGKCLPFFLLHGVKERNLKKRGLQF
jgi:hypothetical protein